LRKTSLNTVALFANLEGILPAFFPFFETLPFFVVKSQYQLYICGFFLDQREPLKFTVKQLLIIGYINPAAVIG